MAAKGVELASAYISLSVSTDGIPREVEKALGSSSKTAERAGKDVADKFNRGAQSTIGKGLSESLAKELGSAGDRGSKEMLRSLSLGYRDAERNVQVVGKKYAQALQNSMSGGGREAATKWEAEFKKALAARDSSKVFFDQFQQQAGARGAKVGTAVGTVIGKSLGAAISVAVTGAAGLATAAVGGLSYSLFKGFDRYKSLDATNKRLRAMGKSGDQVKAIIADINDVVEGTPISLDSAAASATQFLSGGVKEGKQLKEVLTSVADAAGFSGQSFDDLALIFGQVMNKGKLQAEEMLQLNERNIPIQQWLQKELGVTGQELQKMSQDGQISFQNLVDAVESNAPGMAKALGDTIDGALSNMKAAAGRIGANIFAAIFGDPLSTDSGPGGMARSINEVTDRLKDLNTWVAGNGDTIVEWIAKTAKGFTYLGESITVVVAGSTRGLAILVNSLGDSLGAITRGVAFVNRLLGRNEIADDLDRQADSMFGWADSIYRASDEALNLAHEMGGLRPQIDAWKDSVKLASEFTKSLGDAADKIAPQNWWGTTIIKAPTQSEIDQIKQAGFEVKAIPGTKDIEIVPVTEKATAEMNAWRDKQGQQPVTPPVQVDVASANATMSAFVDQWTNAVISPQVQVPGGSTVGPGGPNNPLTAITGASPNPTNANTGGKLTPETQNIQNYLRNALGFKGTIGGWRPPDGFKEHSSGKASDVMVSSTAEGNALLPNLLRQPGVQYILWNQRQWNPDGTSSPMEDRGSPTQNHMDHLHVKTFDTGGGVSGAGGPTSDSIPAWLSNGEHVLTAKDVTAMGGQAGVYAFRNALHRDKGGPIYGPYGPPTPTNDKGNFNPNILIDTSRASISGPPLAEPFWADDRWKGRSSSSWNMNDLKQVITQKPNDVFNPVQDKRRAMRKNDPLWQFFAKGDLYGSSFFSRGGAVGYATGGEVTPEQLQMLAMLANPNNTQHGQAEGAAPGPQQPKQSESNRTGGYIPATAGNTAPVGQGGLSSILGLGESFINNLIDTGAQAASIAATAAAGAASFGAGAAAGPAASTAISMGAEAAKRGVQWGFDMAGIWGEALPEIFMPFGVPRWLGSVDPMAFVPQIPGQQPGQQPGGGAAAQAIQGWAQPGNPAMANGTAQQGAQAALSAAKTQPSYGQAPPAPTPPTQQSTPPINPLDPTTWFGGVFDQGGMLQPNTVGINLSKKPEAVFTQKQLADMQKAAPSATAQSGKGDTIQFYAQDVDSMFREYMKTRRRESRQYSGRP